MTTSSAVAPLGGEAVVGQYRLVRRIGGGATGEVWQGHHVVTGGVAAVKLLRPSAASRPLVRRFFVREARAVARLQHPHIVPLFESGADYLVTAFVDGTDLRRRLASPLDPHLTLRIARQVAGALAHAHQRNVVHRDVKPANILVDRQDNAYLADFGIAWLLDEVDRTAGADRAGTPAFMAPEQHRGEVPGPSADQYALGRTLLAMLAGVAVPPEMPGALERLSEWIPPALRVIVARATATAAGERFSSMAELAEALASVSLVGVAAPPRRAPLVRASEPFAWCARPSAVHEVAPDVARADYTLAGIEPELPPGAAAVLRHTTGLASFGWSVYGRVERLGSVAEPAAAARARAIVVLMHGFLGNRLAWHAIAPALCRDQGDVLVLTPDLHGAGETRFADERPAPAQVTPRALTEAVFAWLGVLGLRGLPTVLVGHSFAGHALLALGDDDLDARTIRVAVTPYINDARNTRRMAVATRVFRVARRCRPLWQVLNAVYLWGQARAEGLSDDFIVPLREELARCDPLLMIRGLESLASSSIATGRLDRCFVLFGENDPYLPRRRVAGVLARHHIPASNARWIASGGHYAFFDSVRSPEAVARNRDEMVRTIEEALEEAGRGTILDSAVSQTRSG